MIKRSMILLLLVSWSLFYIAVNIPRVLSTPEQVVFTQVNKLTKFYALNSEYRDILFNTKSAIVKKNCERTAGEHVCAVKIQFLGPHPTAINKVIQYNLTTRLKETDLFGWVFEDRLTERDILRVAGNVPIADSYDLGDDWKGNNHDVLLWGISFLISWLISPLLLVSYCATIMVYKNRGTTVVFGLLQVLIATYLNLYVTGYHFDEFNLYRTVLGI